MTPGMRALHLRVRELSDPGHRRLVIMQQAEVGAASVALGFLVLGFVVLAVVT